MGRKPNGQETRLPDGERRRLEGIAKDPRSIQKHVWRARIIPGPGSGLSAAETIRRTGKSRPTVERWWDRFPEQGVDGLPPDATRPPGLEPTPEEKVRAVIDLAIPPPPHASHRPLGALAEMLELTAPDVHSILRRNGPVPHQVKTSRVPRDPRSGMKVRDVVGLYADPPDHAVVLSVDEKTRIQAPGRRRRPLPMKPGHAETRTRDYRRNGTTCLPAAPAVATGKVVGQTVERHRPAEFTAFPGHVAEGVEPGTPVHVIPGNVSSHRSAEVHEWLRDRPDWKFHFTPTSASWMNAVEGFFSSLTRQPPTPFSATAGCGRTGRRQPPPDAGTDRVRPAPERITRGPAGASPAGVSGVPGRRPLWGTLWKGPGQPHTEPGKNWKKAGSGLDSRHGCCRMRLRGGGIHRAPQRERRPAFPLEPESGGSRGVVQTGPPQARGDGGG